MKNNKDPFKNTQIVNNYNRFKKSLNNELNEYMEHQSKHRRPHNIDHDTIHRVTTKLQERDETGDKKLILQADKNYGNVIIFESDWDHINDNYVRAGQSNIKPLNCDRTATIENAIRMQVNIVYKYKKLYTNYGKVIGVLNSKRIRTIGKWRASPKVHKRKNGIPIKKIRPLINLKNTIITVASNTIKDITRKVAMAMRSFHNNQTECEDVKDIIIQIIQHNNNDPLNNYASDQQLLVADIGSMYDNITMIDVKKTMNMALKMMPPGLISNEMYNLWFESMDFLEEHLIFDYKEVMYRIYGSQTQGTSSGGDNSTFTVCVCEIKRYYLINKHYSLFLRYKDDIFGIPRKNTNIKQTDEILQAIYYKMDFEFDIQITTNSAIICDICIYIDDEGKLRTKYGDQGKIKRYVLKSSDVVQDINGVFKTLTGRYIVINDDIDSYKETKKMICTNLLKSGWSSYDIRNCVHISYSKRMEIIEQYKANRAHKMKRYIQMNRINVLRKQWFKDDIVYNDENESKEEEITEVIRFNKQTTNAKKLKRAINNSLKTINTHANIYFKYNKCFNEYIR